VGKSKKRGKVYPGKYGQKSLLQQMFYLLRHMLHCSILFATNVVNFETYIVSRFPSFHYNSRRSFDKKVDGPVGRSGGKLKGNFDCPMPQSRMIAHPFMDGYYYDYTKEVTMMFYNNFPP
jgi:hypothetical protein